MLDVVIEFWKYILRRLIKYNFKKLSKDKFESFAQCSLAAFKPSKEKYARKKDASVMDLWIVHIHIICA